MEMTPPPPHDWAPCRAQCEGGHHKNKMHDLSRMENLTWFSVFIFMYLHEYGPSWYNNWTGKTMLSKRESDSVTDTVFWLCTRFCNNGPSQHIWNGNVLLYGTEKATVPLAPKGTAQRFKHEPCEKMILKMTTRWLMNIWADQFPERKTCNGFQLLNTKAAISNLGHLLKRESAPLDMKNLGLNLHSLTMEQRNFSLS